jgi:hypothetical protein
MRQFILFFQKDDFCGSVEFSGVQFHYPSRPDVQVLKGLNIKIQPGQVVALVGSVVQLLERFYDPISGHVVRLTGNNLKISRRKHIMNLSNMFFHNLVIKSVDSTAYATVWLSYQCFTSFTINCMFFICDCMCVDECLCLFPCF